MKTMGRAIIIVCCFLTTGFVMDEVFDAPMVVTGAEARVGRPMTPVSVAGTARRTTRRVIRRTSVLVATLPAGCSTVIIEGTTLHQCGGKYYQPQGGQYVIVQVD